MMLTDDVDFDVDYDIAFGFCLSNFDSLTFNKFF